MRCIERAAKMNSYSIHPLSETPVSKQGERRVYEISIREENQDSYIDIKVAIAGSVDCGKSTLLSVLTKGQPDNGRGAARLAVFNFAHEVEGAGTRWPPYILVTLTLKPSPPPPPLGRERAHVVGRPPDPRL